MSEDVSAPATPEVGELTQLVGHRFPGGHYTIEPWRAWLLADAAETTPDPYLAHPLFAWLATIGGWGTSWDDFFALFAAAAEDGPMFGEHRTTWHRPLRVGEEYRVDGEVVSVERKTGRSTGVFDVVGYQLTLSLPGTTVATCYNSIVFPRGRRTASGVAAAQTSAAQTSAAQTPAAKIPAAQTPAGQTRAAQTPPPEAPPDAVSRPAVHDPPAADDPPATDGTPAAGGNRPGDPLPSWHLARVSAEKMKTMAALLADPNPIHFDVEAVRALGLGERPINQGPLNMAYVLNMLTGWAGGAQNLQEFAVRFVGTVAAGDEVWAGGTVRAGQGGPGGPVEADLHLRRGDGSEVLRGRATVRLGA